MLVRVKNIGTVTFHPYRLTKIDYFSYAELFHAVRKDAVLHQHYPFLNITLSNARIIVSARQAGTSFVSQFANLR